MPETPPYRRPIDQVLDSWGTSLERGLSRQEVRRRRQRYGPNALRAARRRPWWAVLLAQFESLVVLLLLAAAVAAAAFGRTLEGIAIAAALVINAAIGFVTELRAVRSVESLRRLGQASATVVRDGRERDVRADLLVPGDVVRLQEGDVVPADVRLATSESLECDESALTGESVPAAKTTEALADGEAPLAERRNMAFKGTAVSRGSARGVVVATGMASEIGRISELVQEAGEQATPLERRLNRLGQRLIYLVVALAVVIGGSGIAAGQDVFVMFETAIALAIAAVPEGLPIVSTVALGRGVWRMARRNALVKHLSAVETLGAANVILSDKTGTLTENRMALQHVALPSTDVTSAGGEAGLRTDELDTGSRAALTELLRTATLCSNARLGAGGEGDRGDPTEIGLLRAARAADVDPEDLDARWPRTREESFDPETQMMATVHEDGESGFLVAVKGSPEAVLEACTCVAGSGGPADLDDATRRQWRERNEAMAGDGLRVLAVARKTQREPDADPYSELTLLGLVGLHDPPRAKVPEAIARCRAAGIRVVMVTGDQPGTAGRVAHAVGIAEDRRPTVLAGQDIEGEPRDDHIREVQVFARVSPEQKFDIVAALQATGAVVGMTGDGVNDAPALKKADIGIAMGRRGTEVAREAADIVLKDDAFETIVTAVEYGRTIFNNIRKFIVFLLSGNLGQILAVATPALLGAPLPLAPLQILFLNLVLDVFPALAIGVGRSDPTVMHEPPRDPSEAVLTRRHWLAIGGFGLAIATATLGAFALALTVFDMTYPEALAVSFLTYGMARLWHVFNMRSAGAGLIRNDITRNPWIWAALAFSGLLLAAAVYLPPSAAILGVAALEARGWLLVLPASLLPLVVGQAALAIARMRAQSKPPGSGEAHLARS